MCVVTKTNTIKLYKTRRNCDKTSGSTVSFVIGTSFVSKRHVNRQRAEFNEVLGYSFGKRVIGRAPRGVVVDMFACFPGFVVYTKPFN